MKLHRLRRCLLVAALLCLAACTTTPPLVAPAPDADTRTCNDWLDRLDTMVRRAGVADAQEARIAGHPHLRADRFSAAMAQDPRIDDATFVREVLPRMRALDRVARHAEVSNLPQARLTELALSRRDVQRRTLACGAQLSHRQPPPRPAVVVPDSYSGAQRWWGAYALTRHPFSAGVQRQLADVREDFARPLLPPAGGQVQRYAVPEGAAGLPPDIPRDTPPDTPPKVPADAPADTPAEAPAEAVLLERYQPVYDIEVVGDDDRPGALVWHAAQGRPAVRPEQPTVYRHIAFTRYHGRTLKQLVYTIWFGARTANGALDLLAGHLDGLIWRVTIDGRGHALIYDSIHPCGCYHYFLPTSRATAVLPPDDDPEWAIVPQPLHQPRADERIVLRIATRTHYLERATLQTRATIGATALQVLPQDSLRTLPVWALDLVPTETNDRSTRSAYGPDGLVPGSQRTERWLFWPMGIASAGQMRQWGHHATAFVGRRHFDDADLFEKRFVFALEGSDTSDAARCDVATGDSAQ